MCVSGEINDCCKGTLYVRSEEARVDNIHENRFDDEIEAKANRLELQP